MKRKFYVSCSWHGFPEGGTYGNFFTAESHVEALRLCHAEMAQSAAESMGYENEPDTCGYCESSAMDGSGECPLCGATNWMAGTTAAEQAAADYEDQWHEIDCYAVEDSTIGQLLTNLLRAWHGSDDCSDTGRAMDAAAEFFGEGIEKYMQTEEASANG